ncbi:hypothetical protein AVEN_123627-1 [Araneus ventricosus]|uniref:Uncharacterized protein n=1 Tax=Araneus ventricosus TaxID=182803 RepID=A0A4Y2SKU1_ARAVE|nr:hypothetical protein AVEN_123627-1 [Araneus ventricosus]
MAVFELASGENDLNEAVWRILDFPIHERHPTVIHLSVHLENGQRVYFTTENAAQRAQAPQETTLASFFRLCTQDEFARTLLYNQVPKFYTSNNGNKTWQRRKQGQVVPEQAGIRSSDALGRVCTVHPANSECFHLRLLLHEVRGPMSFTDLRTFEGRVCETYKKACQLRRLLDNDDLWNKAL